MGKKHHSNNRYEIKDILGKGGSASVYRAWDHNLHREVAFKRLRAEFREDSEDLQILDEARKVATFQHPNILTVYDCGVDDEGAFVVMELLEGETLKELVARQGVFQQDAFFDAAEQLLEGLIAAHDVGLVHRDLKPPNIMIKQLPSNALQYKILDFGLSKIISEPTEQSTVDNAIVGSVYYISPEQISREPVDARADLYALGCVSYFMLSGAPPFQGKTMLEIIQKHLEHDVADIGKVRSDLSHRLTDWVMSLFSTAVSDRPQSAQKALEKLSEIRAGIDGKKKPVNLDYPLGHHKTNSPATVTHPSHHRSWTPAVLLVVLGLLVLGIVLAMRLSGDKKPADSDAPLEEPVATHVVE